MKYAFRTWLAALALLLAHVASAHDYTAGSLKIDHPWARATAPGQATGIGFMKIINSGKADKLLSASTDVSAAVELHTMEMSGDTMKMRAVAGVAIPDKATVEFKPGGLHIMFINLKAPLKEGTRFPLKLRFEKAGEVNVEVAVESMDGHDDHAGMKH